MKTNELSNRIELCDSQKQALDSLLYGLSLSPIAVLTNSSGMGRTTVLKELNEKLCGRLVNATDVMAALNGKHPLSIEETLEHVLMEALNEHDAVVFDDFDLIADVTSGCRTYPRAGLLETPLSRATAYAVRTDTILVLGCGYRDARSVSRRGYHWSIGDFESCDYSHLCQYFLGTERQLDYSRIHRFAPNLNVHQLKSTCQFVRDDPELDTAGFIDYLKSQHLCSNVELKDVQPVDLNSLIGVDDVIESLESQVILPFENDQIATELTLKPKRGILLSGPPGTGKTTVGRALAQRLKGKFFLVDGTIISGTDHFYDSVAHVFDQAKRNAPSVIFIDDSDVIFQTGDNGLYRYLLTILDGIESEKVGKVCVILTAMNVSSLPPALIRSGRIELWLEMRLPDVKARCSILESHLSELPAEFGDVDANRLAAAAQDFTGADLKRLVEDGKLLFAYDRMQNRVCKPVMDYFEASANRVMENRRRYEEEMRDQDKGQVGILWVENIGSEALSPSE